MTEKIDEFHLAAWRVFLNSHARVIELIEKELQKAEQVPLSSYDVLVALSEAPDRRLRLHELARRVVLSRSGLTRLVDRLENEELLYRERAGDDRRGAYAVLSEKGFEALRRAWPIYAQGIIRHFTTYLTDEETTILTTALTRIYEAAEREE